MQITLPPTPSPIPTIPQLHSRKHHHTYNGTHSLPATTLVQLSTLNSAPTNTDTDETEPLRPVYEVTLFYAHNRACTIYRTSDDFATLRNGLAAWQDASQDLDHFLRKALATRPYDCAMEFFLRRRMGDCEGR
ncbi:hypothetical protein B0T22DRAFT_452988 [Podospora appendiculata]|uniref:Uncharacterized protein n=1 Tax=Podospora appendiculata TaxID=314037 RepID=A0AAE1CHK5_9PEZI|nr:hypothetical protein B0T22DRAFT_452988 [Podospora appendiculata]